MREELRPKHTGYNFDPEDDFDDFQHKNVWGDRRGRRESSDLFNLYWEVENSGGDGHEAVKDEFFKTRLAASTKDLKEIPREEADRILYDNIKQSTVQAWFREYNHEAKDSLIWQMTRSPEVRNATLNVLYDNYKGECRINGDKPLPFDEFLVTPLTVYRGGTGKEYKTAGIFSSYTLNKKVAESFTGSEVGQGASRDPNGVVYEAEIRPIDTYGSIFHNGEAEVLVPRMIAPNGNRDSRTDEEVWRTTENGKHYMIETETGEVTKGNIGQAEPDDKPKRTRKSKKSELNDRIKEIVKNDVSGGSYEGAEKIGEILRGLPDGTVMTVPAGEYDKHTYVKDGPDRWYSKYHGMSLNSNDVAWEFLWENEENRAYISKTAKSEEEELASAKKKERKRQEVLSYRDDIWLDGDLSKRVTIKLEPFDLDHIGEDVPITGKNGETFVKQEDGFWNVTGGHWKKATRADLKGATIEGDYYDTFYGLEGMSQPEVDILRGAIESFPPKAKKSYTDTMTLRPPTIMDGDKAEKAFCQFGQVYIGRNHLSAHTIIHEYGHLLDQGFVDEYIDTDYGRYHAESASSLIWMKCENNETRVADFEHMAKLIGCKTNGDGWFADGTDESEVRRAASDFSHKYGDIPGFSLVTDVISGMTQDFGWWQIYGGHPAAYWQEPVLGASKATLEFWTEFCEAKLCGYDEALELMRQLRPTWCGEAERIFTEAYG